MQKGGPWKGKGIKNNLFLVFIIFSLLVLFSALGLDYIAQKKGEKSYVFSVLAKKKKALSKKEILDHVVLSNLSDHGISSHSIHQYKDSEEVLHLMINLPLEKYFQLAPSLEKKLREAKASILKKKEQQVQEKNYYLWEVKGKKQQRLIILFSCEKERLAKVKKSYPKRVKNKVAIIMDDMGYSLRAINNICSIKRPLTVAILPFSPLAKETARIARQNKLEVILHLPLESINNTEANNGEIGIIDSKMSKDEVIEAVAKSLEQVPSITGVNTHMGSKITTDEIFMRIILERLKMKNLFFIDSRTTSKSVAYKVAQSLDIPSAYRHIFLDTENDEEYIKKKMIELFRLAQKKGQALGICHPTELTLKVLKENFYLVEKYDLKPVFASQIVN